MTERARLPKRWPYFAGRIWTDRQLWGWSMPINPTKEIDRFLTLAMERGHVEESHGMFRLTKVGRDYLGLEPAE